MKRLFAILLSVMMCLQLLACGEQPPEKTMEQVVIDKIAEEENCRAFVLLSVNPSFEIYADDGGIIQKVVAANADAEKVLNGKDYHGESVKVCIPKLLDIMQQQGFLKDGSQLSISTYVHEHSFPSFDYRQEIEDILVSYTSANQISVTYSNTLDVIPAQSTGSTLPPPSADPDPESDPEPDPNAPELTQKYDVDGNLIEALKLPNGDGSERHYNADNILEMVLEYYADGSRVETWFDANGRTTEMKTYDTSGLCTDHAQWNYRADGHTVFHYDGTTGVVMHEEVFTLDGHTVFHYDGTTGAVIHEEVFALDGKRIKSTVWHDWGGKIEEYYDASGQICRVVSQGMDGIVADRQYHESGSTECYYSPTGMLVGETQYDLNGVIFFSRDYTHDTGELRHECTYENGVMTRWLDVDPYSDMQYLRTYVNGIQVKEEISWGDGTYEIITCDSNGYRSIGTTYYTDGRYLITRYAVDQDGEYVCGEAYYDSAGKLTEEYTFASRAEWINHYLPGGPI